MPLPYINIEPYKTHNLTMEPLKNGTCHNIYVEECGNPRGIPVIFLHGGPGSGCNPQNRCYFDPKIYRIILFDQRGCGRSTPSGELENNTSYYLVQDIKTIKEKLGIRRWLVIGSSWGSTLALIYAQHHPDHVMAMILRSVFLGRKQDINWSYAEGGASKLFPEDWHRLVKDLPSTKQEFPLPSYFKMLTNSDENNQIAAVIAIQTWENTILKLRDYEYTHNITVDTILLNKFRIQLHYVLNVCFIKDSPLLDNIDIIRGIPTKIIHGRYDIVCPIQQSWELHQKWPEAKLDIISMAGHASEPLLINAMVNAICEFETKLL